MDSLLLQVNGRFFPSPPQLQPYYLDAQPPPSPQSSGLNLENKVSPSILLIIIILAIVFFVSGLLHLLVRFLWTPPLQRDPESSDNVTAFQGQLQQLFHLHDSGVDQSFIDTLPVFHYKAIIGSKSPFDCAVCLCEFESEDKLRLLPKCSHAFHTECIDTWLLSHSTCPLCRSSLLPDHFSPHSSCAPIVLVLESGSESSRDNVSNAEATTGGTNPITGSNSQMGLGGDSEFEAGSSEIGKLEDSKATVVTVKLGKYKNIDGGEGGCSENKNMDSRRCFSMGSFEYVMDENSSLKVAIRSTPAKKQPSRKPALPLTPGYRAAMSECDCESRRELRLSGIEPFREVKRGENADGNCKKIDSFSVSKIWLRGKNQRETSTDSSRRAVSFRFPIQRNGGDWSASEMGVSRWENEIRSETELDEENQSRCSFDSQFNQSFAKRTLLWLMGKQNKVTHFESSSPSSCISNI